MGVWGRSLQRESRGHSSRWEVEGGRSRPEADEVFVFNCQCICYSFAQNNVLFELFFVLRFMDSQSEFAL